MNNSHRFENLTWPEVNEAVEKGLIPILPVGTVEQHGPHLPIKMDLWTADSVANEAARRRPDRLLAMPVIPYRLHHPRDGLSGQCDGPPRNVHSLRR